MEFKHLFNFLERLKRQNNKAWMDDHRSEYKALRDFFLIWLDDLNERFARIDDHYWDTPPKKAINRINNNLMFHPNKPIYKDYFSAGLDQKSKQGDFYIEIGLEECYVGSGYWHPDAQTLKSIREAIDYNGEEFQEILNSKNFKKYFGKLIDGASLKTSPKGYSVNHDHIDLLRRKSFAAVHYFERKDLDNPLFKDHLVTVYEKMLPFRRYLNTAVSV